MVGTIGVVTETLKPAGMVKINDEYWQAISSDGEIVVGTMVEVIKINGLHLEVRKKES
jgi:membrane protein implicated in regulation of membrane protease activity